MVFQYFLPETTKADALKEAKRRLVVDNSGLPKRQQYEIKSLQKQKSTLKGGQPFYIAKLRKKR